MRGQKADIVRLLHMIDAIEEIESYSIETQENLKNNSMARFACMKQFEIIGEAANHISAQTKNAYPDVKWGEMTGLRNVLIHEYFQIDIPTFWEILQKDVPVLKKQVVEILSALNERYG